MIVRPSPLGGGHSVSSESSEEIKKEGNKIGLLVFLCADAMALGRWLRASRYHVSDELREKQRRLSARG